MQETNTIKFIEPLLLFIDSQVACGPIDFNSAFVPFIQTCSTTSLICTIFVCTKGLDSKPLIQTTV